MNFFFLHCINALFAILSLRKRRQSSLINKTICFNEERRSKNISLKVFRVIRRGTIMSSSDLNWNILAAQSGLIRQQKHFRRQRERLLNPKWRENLWLIRCFSSLRYQRGLELSILFSRGLTWHYLSLVLVWKLQVDNKRKIFA